MIVSLVFRVLILAVVFGEFEVVLNGGCVVGIGLFWDFGGLFVFFVSRFSSEGGVFCGWRD